MCNIVQALEPQTKTELKTVNINHILSIKDHNVELVTVPFVVCDTYRDETEDCEEHAQKQGSKIIMTSKDAPKDWSDLIELPFSFALIDGKLHFNEYEIENTSEDSYPQLKDLFQVEDFNFDAKKGYGFKYSSELTELTNYWMFDVINEDDEQYWHTLDKDGYHYDKSTRWHVINDMPEDYLIYEVERDVEKDGKWQIITETFEPDSNFNF